MGIYMQESGEMYLETILVLQGRLSLVRAIDVVKEMQISKPSASKALKKLKDDGFIEIDSGSGALSFTDS